MRFFTVIASLLFICLVASCSIDESSVDLLVVNDSLEQLIKNEARKADEFLNSGQPVRSDSVISALYEIVLQRNPTPDQLLRVSDELALTKSVLGDAAEARDILERIPPDVLEAGSVEYRDRVVARLARTYNEMGESVKAGNLLSLIVARIEKDGINSEFELLVINSYATILQNIYQYDNAIYWHQRSLEAAGRLDASDRNIATIHNNLAIILELTGRYEESLQELTKSYEINARNNIIAGITMNLNNMANALRSLGRTEEAIDTLRASIRYNEDADNVASLIRNYYNLGNILLSIERLDEAEYYFVKGLSSSRDIDLAFGVMFHTGGLARVYNQLDNPQLAMQFAEEALLWGRRFENLQIQIEALDVIAQIQEQRGQYRLALSSMREFKSLSDSIQTLENQQSIEEVRSRFSFEIISAENELLRQDLAFSESRDEIRRDTLLALATVMLVITGLLILIIRQNRLINKKNNYLAELNDSRENLINIIVHDLRAPLTSLIASLEIIEELTPVKTDDYREIMEVAELSAEKLRMMINGLLDIKSIENTAVADALQSYNIQRITTTVTDNSKLTAAKKKITIETNMESFEAITHAEYYIRVVENLISNALKYSYANSTVTIQLKSEGDNWILKVSDQGQGFSEKDKKDAFQMFKKLSARPTASEPSSGLGLYTVKLLVDRLNGSVELESIQGEGSTFTCIFPLGKLKK
jgi:signal transduction histidine kinase